MNLSVDWRVQTAMHDRALEQGAVEIGTCRRDRLDQLYSQHAEAIARLAYLLTGDRWLAEDLTQEAFARLAGRFTHLRDPDAARPYLRRTVVNLANSHFRRKRIERAFAERERGSAPRAWDPDVATRESVRRALDRLTPRQRAAVVLRYYDDLSERDTAEVLGCRVGTVKSLVSQAMERLRSEMEVETHG
jgi:RNA polymerase sigma-70 factor (sigma-E family)